MKRVIISLLLLGGMVTVTATEANAAVCARGVYRAGCVGPRVVLLSFDIPTGMLTSHREGPMSMAGFIASSGYPG